MKSKAYTKLMILFTLVFTSCFFLVAEGLSQQISTAQVIKLRFSSPFTTAEKCTTVALYFCDLVEKQTNGRVKFERYTGETLGKAPEHLEMVRKKTADVVQLIPGMYAREIPLNAFMNYAGTPIGLTLEETLENTLKLSELPDVKTMLQKEEEKQNFKLLGHMILGYTGTVSRVPFTRYEELKGRKINSWARYNKIWEYYGLAPVNVSIADCYESVSKGVIDAYTQSTFGILGLKVYEPCKYYREFKHVSVGTPLLINQDVWRGLPDDIKKVFMEAAREMSLNSVKVFNENGSLAWKTFKEAGLDAGYLPEENSKTIGKIIWEDSVNNQWHGIAVKAGFKDEADKLIKYYKQVYNLKE
jgi:TRAP-type C4-dicarboxylate transport system substrate-binding protein